MRPRTAAPAALLVLAATALPALTPPATAAPAPPVPVRTALTAPALTAPAEPVPADEPTPAAKPKPKPADKPTPAAKPKPAGKPTPTAKPQPAHQRPAREPSAPGRTAHERGVLLTVSGSDNTWIRGVRLSCAPEPSGPHPFAGRACAELDHARGDLDALPKENRACTKQFDPVTASATGTHRGRPVTWHRTYGNACEMAAATGHVFRF
ncbi:hypothetical protein GCM10018785_10500 [Streptomyces longispororuber]|uniref:Subtilisin inhibitor domain-containing protein n=1 Tax=Streptomyces longispororuber TaxID=68230 RepID=A0A919DFE6_9ACTN|nr:SSI family serine proteinase inhibitor [Streptomyces longispororuber]GHE42792.1 hypothetical protein GCM10018785_10500 [Streptomyces longispororuber]